MTKVVYLWNLFDMKRRPPGFIVHYTRGELFRSITSTARHQLPTVINSLNEQNSWGLSRFADPTYLEQRFEVEKLVRARFIAMGGAPVLLAPIYFFLGRNKRFEEHPLNIGYAIDLVHLHRESISFSYGDTMLSFNMENRKVAGEKYTNPLCDRLFMLDELEDLISNDLSSSQSPLAVEAQLWVSPTNEIVRKLER